MVSSFFHCFKVYSSLKVFNEYFHSRFSMISRSSIVARSVMVSGSFLVLRSICLQWLLGTFLSESQFTIDLWKHGIFIIWLNIFSRNSNLTTSIVCLSFLLCIHPWSKPLINHTKYPRVINSHQRSSRSNVKCYKCYQRYKCYQCYKCFYYVDDNWFLILINQ